MPAQARPRAVLIAGPTASGKSAVALALAERIGGVIVNADSMQVYREVPILTAQPSMVDQSRAPHYLYGHVPAVEAYSAGRFATEVADVLSAADQARRCPIIVGGTGLYFDALLSGLSPIPAIPAHVRAQWRARAATGEALWPELLRLDPVMAARLDPTDTQRIVRALEVATATGRSLAEWQRDARRRVLDPAATVRIVIRRERAEIQRRCDVRFEAMIRDGALAEVAALAEAQIPSDRPAMKALGVPPLLAHVAGDVALDEAVAQAKADTRRYVKRQQTWLAKFMADWTPLAGELADDPRAAADAIAVRLDA